MSQISFEFFRQSPFLALPVIAMGLFIVVFVGGVVRVARLSKEHVNAMSEMPLTGDEGHE